MHSASVFSWLLNRFWFLDLSSPLFSSRARARIKNSNAVTFNSLSSNVFITASMQCFFLPLGIRLIHVGLVFISDRHFLPARIEALRKHSIYRRYGLSMASCTECLQSVRKHPLNIRSEMHLSAHITSIMCMLNGLFTRHGLNKK